MPFPSLSSLDLSTMIQKPVASTDHRLASKNQEEIYKVSRDFSISFFTQCLQDILKHAPALGGFTEEMYQSFLAESIAEQCVESSIGQDITQMIIQQLTHLQEQEKKD